MIKTCQLCLSINSMAYWEAASVVVKSIGFGVNQLGSLDYFIKMKANKTYGAAEHSGWEGKLEKLEGNALS